MRKLKNLLVGIVLVLLAIAVDRQFKEKAVPPNTWTRRAIIALIGAALILVVNAYLCWRL